ncbi:DASH family cryptochrome [Pedobacter sp. SYSU D00535]|uniref:DASH family cryptochrome n=1 Tax=Pedobacter sp. SYSU D00535 TaxID=2810308 RepID=UPI001A957415|nr:DASH family cryptochrome [Pedobacter sp. SYSU D00535]
MSEKTILIWFRNDLRIHDNEILLEAVRRSERVVPVYCFDPRYFDVSKYGTRTTGALRAKFLLESVVALKYALQQLGGDLVIKTGKPEEVLPEICAAYNVTEVYHHREVAARETEISGLVEEALWKQQINLKHFIGHTLYHKEDLPFPIKNIPNDFMVFRKKVERDSVVKPCFDTPVKIAVPSDLEPGEVPVMADLGLEQVKGGSLEFKGGELQGLQHLNTVLFEAREKKTNLKSFSSGLSPWLSIGCLSVREVYWAVKGHKQLSGATEVGAKILTELQWRDFFRFMLKKYGSQLLEEQAPEKELSAEDVKKLKKWQDGHTGEPVVDVCVAELNANGYISDKATQYVSSYLVNSLGITWQAGSAYFEEKAIDFSPANNWGNWAFLVGDGIMAKSRSLLVKPEEILAESSIKRRFTELNAPNSAQEVKTV